MLGNLLRCVPPKIRLQRAAIKWWRCERLFTDGEYIEEVVDQQYRDWTVDWTPSYPGLKTCLQNFQ